MVIVQNRHYRFELQSYEKGNERKITLQIGGNLLNFKC